MVRALTLLLSLFLLSSLCKVSSQTELFRNLSVNDGLASNFIKCIYKDYNGFIWIGSLEGLNRFDGTEIKSYPIEIGGVQESVNSIIQPDSNLLLVGTDAGLFELNLRTETFHFVPTMNPSLKITVLGRTDGNGILVGTDNGLYHYSHGGLKQVFKSPSLVSANYITGLVAEKTGYWLSTMAGLIYVEKTGKPNYKYADKLGFNCITQMNDKLYIGSKNKGLRVFDLNHHTFSSIPEFDNDIILTLSNNGKDCIYAGTDGNGLKLLSPSTGKIEFIRGNENSPFSLSSSSIYSFLYCDGTYWIGTYSGGLNYRTYSRKLFDVQIFGSDFPTYNKSIRSFYFAPAGEVLIGGRNGFYFFDPTSKRTLQYFASPTYALRANIILTIYPFEGNYLIGTYGGGACVFNSKTKQFSDFSGIDIKSGSVYQFARDDLGALWISTLNGVYCYNVQSKTTEHYTSENSGLPSNETYAIKIDSRRRIWVGTMNGSCLLVPEENKFRTDLFPTGFRNKFRTTNFYEDRSGNIWVSTEKGGLFRISANLDQAYNFTVKEGLPDNAICAVIQDQNRDIWVSTLNGFCRIANSSSQITTYEMSDGLPGKVFNPSAVGELPNGYYVWGNEKGLVSFYPDSMTKVALEAPIRFTMFYLAGKEVKVEEGSPLEQSIETTKQIILSHDQNSIGFRFTALNYLNGKDNRYIYMLEGFDTEWQQAGSQNTAFYNDLPHGQYTFKVRLQGGENSNKVGTMGITIKRSFFSTPYFYLMIMLVFAISVFIIYNRFRLIKDKLLLVAQSAEKRVSEKNKVQKIGDSEAEKIKSDLLSLMETQKPFISTNLKLTDISKETGYSIHEISHVLNQTMQTNFSDFVNNYRVMECKARMLDEKYSKFTLTAIAEQCGFNSKASFYRAFKKVTNTTPAEYFKDYKNR